MDYDTLVSTIKSYVENTFPATLGASGLSSDEQVNTFIEQAERRVYNTVQALVTRKTGNITCVDGTSTAATPADWMAPYSLAVVVSGSRYFLLNKDTSFIRESFPSPTTEGQPQFYAMQDNDLILFGPTPDSGYTVEADYFYYPESIVTATTTWLGNNFESVLLYGALLEAATFMQLEADIVGLYQKRYDEALAMLKIHAEGKDRQDNYRTAPVRYPVR